MWLTPISMLGVSVIGFVTILRTNNPYGWFVDWANYYQYLPIIFSF